MKDIHILPPEVLQQIFAYLDCSDLVSVSGTKDDAFLRGVATRMRSSWLDSSHVLNSSEWDIATDLVTEGEGHLPEDVRETLVPKSSLRMRSGPSVAELRFAAALAATGHLTRLAYPQLKNLDLSGIEGITSLAGIVTGVVFLDGVTGDISPFLTNLRFQEMLTINNMELDEAATRSLLVALQQGVRSLGLGTGARLHIQTLLGYDGKGRCDEVRCWGAARDIYRDQLMEWAARVNWEVWRDDGWGICLVRK